MNRETACVTPHEPGTCMVCDWCYRRTGQIRAAARCIDRARRLSDDDEVSNLLKEAIAYLQAPPRDEDKECKGCGICFSALPKNARDIVTAAFAAVDEYDCEATIPTPTTPWARLCTAVKKARG